MLMLNAGSPLAASAQGAEAPALMPYPHALQTGKPPLGFDGAFQVQWRQAPGPFLSAAVDRFLVDAHRLTGLDAKAGVGIGLRIECCDREPVADTLGEPEDEAYRLQVDATGVRIEAATSLGVVRALATLRQLISVSAGSGRLAWVLIEDQPRFAWRGVMIDVVRHFMPVAALKRQIDAMELMKLNVLHLHLSDNQGYRVESLLYPELTKANGRDFYTQAQIRDLVAYARARGVRVVPEIDVPGHARAMIRAYPFLSSGMDGAPIPGGAAINVARSQTYKFLRGMFAEIAALFPDRYLHVGGDEVSGKDWLQNDEVLGYMRARGIADKQALQEHFLIRLKRELDPLGKRIVGWEEILSENMPQDMVVQTWKSSAATDHATRKADQVIVSAGYYLDLLMPASAHYRMDPLDPTAYGMDQADQRASQVRLPPERARYFTPDLVRYPALKLSRRQQTRVIGAEAALWSGLVTDEMLDGRLWPRMAALAERFWSDATVRDEQNMYRRLLPVQDQLRILGVADVADARRMLARLAPGHAEDLENFIGLVAPVRNFAHMNPIRSLADGVARPTQSFNTLADAALPESTLAAAFNLSAATVRAGDRARLADLRGRLRAWQDLSARLQRLADRYAALRTAVPVFADVAQLAGIGLQALDAIERGAGVDARWLADACPVLARHARDEKASDSLYAVLTTPEQPAADLLVAIVPGIRTLVERGAQAQGTAAPSCSAGLTRN